VTTRAKDRIRLPDGREMTLGEALDAGLVWVDRKTTPHRKLENPNGSPRMITRYMARSLDGSVFWTIGQKLWESRTRSKAQHLKPENAQ